MIGGLELGVKGLGDPRRRGCHPPGAGGASRSHIFVQVFRRVISLTPWRALIPKARSSPQPRAGHHCSGALSVRTCLYLQLGCKTGKKHVGPWARDCSSSLDGAGGALWWEPAFRACVTPFMPDQLGPLKNPDVHRGIASTDANIPALLCAPPCRLTS